MNMASIAALFLFFIVIRAQSEGQTFITVECKTGNVVQYGQQSMLDCVVKTTQVVRDATILVVSWEKEDTKGAVRVLTFEKGRIDPKPGFRFAEPSWNDKNMNVSLLITNTTLKDIGKYKCVVMTDSGDNTNHTNLSVTAKYNEPMIHSIPEKITRDEDVTLICTSEGGYPEGRLGWFDEHGIKWPDSSPLQVENASNGLFKLTSRLSLLKNTIFSKYTCKVFNASGAKEGETALEIPGKVAEQEGRKELDEPTKIVAPVVVIGSLIVGMLLALLVYRRRSRSDHHRVSESAAEEGDHLNIETQ
ncbi:butyrophilin-like protein 10 isoform X2 [Scomber japonicus]|uniref:butyrophilin-like protein 10 isoform X2 n=1 Tax=Scomber japonicus TaxID=13676 RepID=UPI002305692D|nr:butyrophilin-like protein 10 isoform X2 [Scomber japonicus]